MLNITGIFNPKRFDLKENRLLMFLVFSFILFWIFSWFVTDDQANWHIENMLTFSSFVIFSITYKRFKFSDVSYFFIVFFLFTHVYGSIYTYANNPFGFWLMEVFNWERNHYDRIIHFFSGFILAYPVVELSHRALKVPKHLLVYTPFLFAISTGALYEIMEWAVADLFFPNQGTNYLGTQGDVWDAQKDMALAVLGAVITMPFLDIYLRKNLN